MAHNEHYKHIPKEFQPETFGNLIPLPYSLQDILKRLVRLETKGEKLKDCEKIINNWNVFKEFQNKTIYKLTAEQIGYFNSVIHEYHNNNQVLDICRDYVDELYIFIVMPHTHHSHGSLLNLRNNDIFFRFMETKLIPQIKEILIKTKLTNTNL